MMLIVARSGLNIYTGLSLRDPVLEEVGIRYTCPSLVLTCIHRTETYLCGRMEDYQSCERSVRVQRLVLVCAVAYHRLCRSITFLNCCLIIYTRAHRLTITQKQIDTMLEFLQLFELPFGTARFMKMLGLVP